MAPPLSSDGSSTSTRILVYFGALMVLINVAAPTGFLLDVGTSYSLKNQLGASAAEVSTFRLLTAIPGYLGIFFGLFRDTWIARGGGDRRLFGMFASVTAFVMIGLALVPASYLFLIVGMLLATTAFGFVGAAYSGRMVVVSQRRLMSGRLSATFNLLGSFTAVVAALASGWVTAHFTSAGTFTVIAIIACAIALSPQWAPRGVFDETCEHQDHRSALASDIRRLLKHRPIYPVMLILFLWNFEPGGVTPLQFYLTNELHASDAMFPYFFAILLASFLPMYLLYGVICRQVSLNRLLWWGTIVAVPQFVPLAFVRSVDHVLLLAIPMGLMGGIATAAYFDLAMRAAPPGLQGTFMGLVGALSLLSARGGDVLGAAVYDSSPKYGFLYCVIAITVAYSLILPTLLWVPADLTHRADGQGVSAPRSDTSPTAESRLG